MYFLKKVYNLSLHKGNQTSDSGVWNHRSLCLFFSMIGHDSHMTVSSKIGGPGHLKYEQKKGQLYEFSRHLFFHRRKDMSPHSLRLAVRPLTHFSRPRYSTGCLCSSWVGFPPSYSTCRWFCRWRFWPELHTSGKSSRDSLDWDILSLHHTFQMHCHSNTDLQSKIKDATVMKQESSVPRHTLFHMASLQYFKTWGNKITNSIFHKPLPQRRLHTHSIQQIWFMTWLFYHNFYANSGWQELKL